MRDPAMFGTLILRPSQTGSGKWLATCKKYNIVRSGCDPLDAAESLICEIEAVLDFCELHDLDPLDND